MVIRDQSPLSQTEGGKFTVVVSTCLLHLNWSNPWPGFKSWMFMFHDGSLNELW